MEKRNKEKEAKISLKASVKAVSRPIILTTSPFTSSKISFPSNAKINLALDILNVQKSGKFKGYHRIQTVICEITPQNTAGFKPDFIEIEAKPRLVGATSPQPTSPCPNLSVFESTPSGTPTSVNKNNTILKAAKLILKKCKISAHAIKITVTKNIPASSGLGGGSSNAAAVIKGLNHLLKLNLSTQKMRELAKEISMDTPFFITGGIALAENFGEIITQLPPVKGLAFTITTPQIRQLKNKTKSQYKKINLKKCGKNTEKTAKLIHAIKTNDALAIHSLLHNDFETLLKNPLPQNIHLSGAGPTTFILA